MKIVDGYLFISMGERYFAKDSAQTLTNDFGKIIRLYDDGRIPADNPFNKQKDARPEIWSYGHRNPQGMALNPATNELWINEHGPQGGDEINIIKPGINYGWPVICYGIDYNDSIIGKGITHMNGMEQPINYYRPSIAPSGMEFYTGNAFPKWKHNLFIGALALRHLNRLTVEGNRIIHEERSLEDQKWRIRFVKQGPDELLYIGVDNGNIIRIRPV
jgi:glucose/arabinose dehydrogenase